MRVRATALAVIAAAGAAPAPAQPVPDRAAAFVAVVQANGCAITEAEGAALLPPAGLTMADAQDAAALMNRGRLFTVDDDGATMRLVPELCAADAAGVALLLAEAAQAPEPGVQALGLYDRVDPTVAAALVQLVRANGCAMTQDEAGAILPPMGYAPEQTQDIAAILVEGWMAEIDGDTLRLTEAACASDPATDAAYVEIVLAQGRLMEAGGGDPADPATLRAIAVMWSDSANACILDTADVEGPTGIAWTILGLDDAPEAERAALAARMAAILADPGPAWRFDPDLPAGQLRRAYCSN